MRIQTLTFLDCFVQSFCKFSPSKWFSNCTNSFNKFIVVKSRLFGLRIVVIFVSFAIFGFSLFVLRPRHVVLAARGNGQRSGASYLHFPSNPLTDCSNALILPSTSLHSCFCLFALTLFVCVILISLCDFDIYFCISFGFHGWFGFISYFFVENREYDIRLPRHQANESAGSGWTVRLRCVSWTTKAYIWVKFIFCVILLLLLFFFLNFKSQECHAI